MRYHPFIHTFTALTVITLSLFSLVSTVQAKGSATVGTTLTFETPVPVSVGNPSTVVLQLISSKGEPVANQRVDLFVDGLRERSAKTDASGNASFRVRRDVAGAYALQATFKGSKLPSLGSSKASAELVVEPAVVEIHVTPSLPDIKFSLGGQIFSSDDYGVARIEVEKAGAYRLQLLPLEIKDENIQMQFGRWGDEVFQPDREIEVPLKKPLEIGFEVSYQVSQTFVDLAHEPVESERVTSITYKGSNGATFTFEDTGPHWLPSGRVIRLNNGLEETKILYSVMSIVIDGANVVSQAQQRFYVDPNDIWNIQLLLYSANFRARDALFGFPIGSGIHMEYPDGEVQSYSFDTDKGYTIEGLARGIYRVTVIGADGFAPATPIALSRDQDVDLLVFSYIDIGVLLSLGLLLSVGLILFGRPYLVRQTAALVYRIVPKRRSTQPAVRIRIFDKLIALRARILHKGQITRLEDSDNARALDDTGPEEKQGVQLEEGILQAETVDLEQDHSTEEMNDPHQKRTRRSRQSNKIKTPV